MATKPEFLPSNKDILVAMATVSVAILSLWDGYWNTMPVLSLQLVKVKG